MTKGVVSRVTSKGFAIDHFPSPSQLAIQIDAAINPGNSGGPALCVLLLSLFYHVLLPS
jgi:S1-C subfamily serine protease